MELRQEYGKSATKQPNKTIRDSKNILNQGDDVIHPRYLDDDNVIMREEKNNEYNYKKKFI